MDGRPGRPEVYVPCYAQRNGIGHRGHRVDPDLRVDRSDRRVPSLRLADDPRLVPGRRVWRRHHLCCRTYVAEHVPDESRGYYTGWLQTSPTLGIVVSLGVIIGTRTYYGNEVFNAWAWRVPFLVSFLLVAIAIWIRLQLQETPIFEEIRAKGQMTKNPWKEAFLSSNIKFVLIACIVLIGQGVVWYSGQFWALCFLQQVPKA